MAEWALVRVLGLLKAASKALARVKKSPEEAAIYTTGLPEEVRKDSKKRRQVASLAQDAIEETIRMLANAPHVHVDNMEVNNEKIEKVELRTIDENGNVRTITVVPKEDREGNVIVDVSQLVRDTPKEVTATAEMNVVHRKEPGQEPSKTEIKILRERHPYYTLHELYKDRIIETLSLYYPNYARLIAKIIKTGRYPDYGKEEEIAPVTFFRYAIDGHEEKMGDTKIKYKAEENAIKINIGPRYDFDEKHPRYEIELREGHAFILTPIGILHIKPDEGKVDVYSLDERGSVEDLVEKYSPELILLHGRPKAEIEEGRRLLPILERYHTGVNWKKEAKRSNRLRERIRRTFKII